ncbi:MAG: SDR family NAD(P)-dependent oxidoreductase [Syntrophomonas sp.]
MESASRTIVITGASKGLGREIALYLSRKNSYLILIARSKELLEELKTEIQKISGRTPLIIKCDISNENDLNHILEIIQGKFQQIDVLINNAGIAIHRVSEQITGEEMRKQFETNVYGVFYCIRTLLPLIKNSNSGYILNIGSLTSIIPFADNTIYAATKSAVAVMSEGLYHELKKINIKVGLFLPGILDTSFQKDREGVVLRIPAFLILNPEKAAVIIGKMISKRKKKTVMYRWMLMFMKMKQLLTK